MALTRAGILRVGTASTTGAIRVGTGLSVTSDGVLSLSGGTNFPGTPISVPTTWPGSIGSPWNSGPANLTATGCLEISTNNTTFTQSTLPINNGDILYVRWINSPSCTGAAQGTVLTGTITDGVNTFSANFTVDRIPNNFLFGDVADQGLNATVTSNPLQIAGITVPSYVTLDASSTLTGIQASIGSTAFVNIPTSGTTLTIQPNQTIQLRGTTGNTVNTTYFASVRIGDTVAGVVTDRWDVTTISASPTVGEPNIVSPANGATGLNPNSNTPAGIPLVGSAYSAFNGAGTHATSDWQVYRAGTINPYSSPITSIATTPVFGYRIDRSVRLNASQNSYLEKYYATNGTSRRTWTWSGWIKKTVNGINQGILVAGNTEQNNIVFKINSDNKFEFIDTISAIEAANFITNATFTDTSKWMHVLLAVDTTSSFNNQRIRFYVNGVEITNFDIVNYYAQNADTSLNTATNTKLAVEGITSLSSYFDGYFSAIHFIDGQQLSPSSFGVFSGSSWVPINYSGTYGINGYQLLFNTNTSSFPSPLSLGKDTSGNNNDFNPIKVIAQNSTTIGFYGNNSNFPVLIVGAGGTGNYWPDVFRRGEAGGGGGGGVATTVFNVSSSYEEIPSISSGIVTFVGLRAEQPVGLAATGNGATSGYPTQNAGGSVQYNGTDWIAGGGGGAGGPAPSNATGVGGPGLFSTIRSNAGEYFGVGGNGRSNVQAPDEGNPGLGLPGNRSAGIIVRRDNPATDIITIGGNLPLTTTLVNTSIAYTIQDNVDGIYKRPELQYCWVTDSPTAGIQTNTGIGNEVSGNYCILDVNKNNNNISVSNAGLSYLTSGGTILGTSALSSGKYYWEISSLDSTSAVKGNVGVNLGTTETSSNPGFSTSSYAFIADTGNIVNNSITTAYGSIVGLGETIGVAFDVDNGRLYFSINGVWQNGGNPVTQTNPAFSSLNVGTYYPSFGSGSGVLNSVNFGQRPYSYIAPTGFGPVTDNPLFTTLNLENSTQLSNFQVGDVVTELGGGNDGRGVVNGINIPSSQITLAQPQGSFGIGTTLVNISRFSYAPAPPTDPPNPSQYQQIVNIVGSATTLTNYNIPAAGLSTSSRYYSRIRYSSNDSTPIVSEWSQYSQFDTGYFTPQPGTPLGGGYYAGQINVSGTIYNLIVAPVTGTGGQQGQLGPTQYKINGSNDGAGDASYGGLITANFADGNHPMFDWCVNGPNGPRSNGGIGGFTDWYIPAKNELAILYFFLKPESGGNDVNSGINPNSVAPYTPNRNYGDGFPNQTTSTLFQTGGAQAFATGAPGYLSATETSDGFDLIWFQYFSGGTQGTTVKTNSGNARAVRRIPA